MNPASNHMNNNIAGWYTDGIFLVNNKSAIEWNNTNRTQLTLCLWNVYNNNHPPMYSHDAIENLNPNHSEISQIKLNIIGSYEFADNNPIAK